MGEVTPFDTWSKIVCPSKSAALTASHQTCRGIKKQHYITIMTSVYMLINIDLEKATLIKHRNELRLNKYILITSVGEK